MRDTFELRVPAFRGYFAQVEGERLDREVKSYLKDLYGSSAAFGWRVVGCEDGGYIRVRRDADPQVSAFVETLRGWGVEIGAETPFSVTFHGAETFKNGVTSLRVGCAGYSMKVEAGRTTWTLPASTVGKLAAILGGFPPGAKIAAGPRDGFEITYEVTPVV